MRIVILGIIIASTGVSVGCGQVKHRTQLMQSLGQIQTASIGGAIATIRKEKDLPNIVGGADIFGRKVGAGFTKLIFRGRGKRGEVLIERVEIDVHSTATTMSRTPGIYTAQSTAAVSGNAYGVSGYGQSSAMATSPIGESTTVLPPRSTRFAVPAGKTLTLATGQIIEFVTIEPHQVAYRIRADGST